VETREAAAPVVAGIGMEKLGLGAPLLAAAALKIAYDLVLWFSFRHRPPPEERGASPE